MPLLSSWLISLRAVSIGIAKPMPTLPLPLPPVSIWELIPITLPEASISGPPELPGLIAASVWITLEIEKPLGAWIWRCSAETMPLVTVRSRPNGLPIATTGSPTSTFEESPSGSGWSWLDGASTLSSARSVAGSVPTTFGGVGRVGGAELDLDLVGAFDHVVVGEDVAFGVDHEARAGRGAAAFGFFFAERAERRGGAPGGLVGLDEGDALPVAAVDLVDDVGVAAALCWTIGAASGAATVVVELPWASIQPAAIAIQPKTATTAPPSRAEPNGCTEESLHLASHAGNDASGR